MKILNNLINNFYLKLIFQYFSLILGLIFLGLFIYFRFIRERLPRDIPFELTEFRFYVLIYICLIYLYIIFRTLKPKVPPEFISKIFEKIYKPLFDLDIYLKYKLLVNYYALIYIYLASKLSMFTSYDVKLIYYSFSLIPRLILLILFMLDVYWFKQLSIVYYFIAVGLIPYIYTYFNYTIYVYYEGYLKRLEEYYRVINIEEKGNDFPGEWIPFTNENIARYNEVHSPKAIHHDTLVSIKEYIKIQYEVFLARDPNDKETLYEYEGHPFAQANIRKEYKKNTNKTELTNNDYAELNKEFHTYMPPLLQLYFFMELRKVIEASPIIKYIKILIYFCYFITWLYILLLSYPTLKDFGLTLRLLQILITNLNPISVDPFSDLTIS